MAKAAEAIERKLRSGRAAPDLIVEVRDARLPLSSANPSLAEAGRGKPRLVVFNKSDLANSNMRTRTEACVRARDKVNKIPSSLQTRCTTDNLRRSEVGHSGRLADYVQGASQEPQPAPRSHGAGQRRCAGDA